jgi:predicted RNase H-like HicB family nuclease
MSSDILKKAKVSIWWSAEDECFRADVSDGGGTLKVHGDTPEEALKNAREVFELAQEGEGAQAEAEQQFGEAVTKVGGE